MKKIMLIASLGLSLFVSTEVFADGCAALANTKWKGQAKLITKAIVPINVAITSVNNVGGMSELKGTINGEALTGMFGCTEKNDGQIASVTFGSNTYSISGMQFLPNAKNPTSIKALGGKYQNSYVDTTTNPSQNYLNKI